MTRLRKLVAASSRDLLILLGVITVLALVPLGVSNFTLSVATAALIFALAGIGWNVLSGFAGQFSFGHAAYFGLGAYTVAVTFTKYSISPWLGLVLGGLVAATFGLLTGWISFRFGLKGAYFALATFALAELLRLTFNQFDYVGAGIGITIPLAGGARGRGRSGIAGDKSAASQVGCHRRERVHNCRRRWLLRHVSDVCRL